MTLEEYEILKSVMEDDDAVAEYGIDGKYISFHCIVPNDISTEKMDIIACLEDTLHRLLEKAERDKLDEKGTEELVYQVIGAVKDAPDDEDSVPIDLGYSLEYPIIYFRRVSETAYHFEQKIYERYKLAWMIEHRITLEDAFSEFMDYLDPENGFEWGTPAREAFEGWESDSGFSGSEYSCFDEFLETEYPHISEFLLMNEREKKIWKLDAEEEKEEKGKYDCVLIVAPAYSGVSIDQMAKMTKYFKDSSDGFYPVDIVDDNENTSAVGYISSDVFEKLDYDIRPLRDYILNLWEKQEENENGIYHVVLVSNYSSTAVSFTLCMQYRYY